MSTGALSLIAVLTTETGSVFSPNSPQAAALTHLFRQTLGVCAVIFILVAGLVSYCIVRFRRKTGDGEPRQVAGHQTLEVVWTVTPFLILVWLFILTVHAMNVSDPPSDRDPDLVVIGHQWWWEVQYPKSGLVTANEIHLPVGTNWLVRLESRDVIHCFWAPQLARKMDMVPGHPNQIWLAADKIGTYLGDCAEYCGTQHAWMRFLVIAQSRDAFDSWQRQQLQPEPAPTTPAAQHGLQIFHQMTCVNCHAISGTGATERVAPDLTHLAGRQTLAAGILENNPVNLAHWLQDPQAIKPGCFMPNLTLTDAQVAELVNYFETQQ